jgi:phosphoserine phosphatase
MAHVLTLVAPSGEALRTAGAALRDALASAPEIHSLEAECAEDWLFADDFLPGLAGLKLMLDPLPVDYAFQAVANRKKLLLLADMDSTIISCECLDELADYAGKKAQIAEITERAMRGELAFEEALRSRVRLLAGLSEASLAACYEERVRLNPGARALVTTMAHFGARCVLVSGGFSYFTRRVQVLAGFDAEVSNTLLLADGCLTGAVGQPIIGKEAKAARLTAECAQLGIAPSQAMAIGDGANDAAMISMAGLGIAYRAKPVLSALATARIQHTDLTAALYFQGYRRAEHVDGD